MDLSLPIEPQPARHTNQEDPGEADQDATPSITTFELHTVHTTL